MNIYELVTPSDPITFKAKDDKVAFTCALLLGRGKAGCHRRDENNNEVNLETLLMFASEEMIDSTIQEKLGCDIDAFIKSNKADVKACFQSFAYGSIEDRKTYDDAIEAITDPEKLKEFKSKHEDRNRTSMSQWVQGAWDYAEQLKV